MYESIDMAHPAHSLSEQNSVGQETNWKSVLREEKQKEYFKQVVKFVEGERQQGKLIFPPNSQVFSALASTPLENVRVVIIGQDPYHGQGQAHGLCFSVQEGITPPPSLVNIFKELESDLGISRPDSGSLTGWAEQGVLLLNAVLTVQAHNAGSHAGKGWETFTDKVIEVVNDNLQSVVFLLWGSYAQKKGAFIDTQKHCVLKSPHPSPLSAHRGFFGSKHFSKANEYLVSKGREPIDWSKFKARTA